jgi:hypothetical protein
VWAPYVACFRRFYVWLQVGADPLLPDLAADFGDYPQHFKDHAAKFAEPGEYPRMCGQVACVCVSLFSVVPRNFSYHPDSLLADADVLTPAKSQLEKMWVDFTPLEQVPHRIRTQEHVECGVPGIGRRALGMSAVAVVP